MIMSRGNVILNYTIGDGKKYKSLRCKAITIPFCFLLTFAKSCKMGANRVRFDEIFGHFFKTHPNYFNYLGKP